MNKVPVETGQKGTRATLQTAKFQASNSFLTAQKPSAQTDPESLTRRPRTGTEREGSAATRRQEECGKQGEPPPQGRTQPCWGSTHRSNTTRKRTETVPRKAKLPLWIPQRQPQRFSLEEDSTVESKSSQWAGETAQWGEHPPCKSKALRSHLQYLYKKLTDAEDGS